MGEEAWAAPREARRLTTLRPSGAPWPGPGPPPGLLREENTPKGPSSLVLVED